MNELEAIEWTDKESVLAQMTSLMNALFQGRCFYAERNSCKGEVDVDLFINGNPHRVGDFWPKIRGHYFNIRLNLDMVERLRLKIELPPVKEDKREKCPGFRTYHAVSIVKTEEILRAISELD